MIDKDLNKLDPNFKKKVSDFLLEVGDEIFITEGFRSQQRQNELYAQGRTKPGKIVTWTKNSLHTKGQAIDIAFKGKELYPKDISKWEYIRAIAKKHGIDNLGTKDKPHLQDNFTPYKQTNMTDIQKFIILGNIYSLCDLVKSEIQTNELSKQIIDIQKTLDDIFTTNKIKLGNQARL